MKQRPKIFRTEVIEAMTAQHGEVILIQPIGFNLITGFIVAVLLTMLTFLYFAEYTESLPVKGILKSRDGEAKVMAYQPGIIERVYITEGDKVKQNDPLYKIRTDKQGEEGSVNTKLIDSIKQSIALIHQKISYQQQLDKLEIEDLTRSAVRFKKKAAQTMEEVEIKEDHMKLLDTELSILSKLKTTKQASQTEYNAKYAQVLEARLGVKTLKRNHSELLDKAQTAESATRNVKVQGQSMIVTYQQKLADLERELANQEADKFYVINAPRAGVVANIFFKGGHFVEVNKPLMTILPVDHQLVAEIYIPTSAIAYIKLGQAINIRYHAFPFQKFGLFDGHIEQISKTLIKPFQAADESLVNGPSYRATVTLSEQSVGTQSSITLQTGMLLDADVIADTHSMLSWLFDSIFSTSTEQQGAGE